MSEVIEARERLAEIAKLLREASDGLAHVSRQAEPLEREYKAFTDDYELGLLLRSEDERDYKLPSESLRLKLASRAFTKEHPERMGKMLAYQESRKRLIQRISDLKHTAECQRSILSALKAELDATS